MACWSYFEVGKVIYRLCWDNLSYGDFVFIPCVYSLPIVERLKRDAQKFDTVIKIEIGEYGGKWGVGFWRL